MTTPLARALATGFGGVRVLGEAAPVEQTKRRRLNWGLSSRFRFARAHSGLGAVPRAPKAAATVRVSGGVRVAAAAREATRALLRRGGFFLQLLAAPERRKRRGQARQDTRAFGGVGAHAVQGGDLDVGVGLADAREEGERRVFVASPHANKK